MNSIFCSCDDVKEVHNLLKERREKLMAIKKRKVTSDEQSTQLSTKESKSVCATANRKEKMANFSSVTIDYNNKSG
jgi:hypothetical protein